MGKYFGTDGFRGEAGVTLTAEQAYRVGLILGYLYGREKGKCRAVLGKDTRLSSYMLEYALASGLTAAGADAYILHVTTTPSVSYITRCDGFDCGIMISASHNPYYDNIGNTWGCGNMQQKYIRPGRRKTGNQRIFKHIAASARILSNHHPAPGILMLLSVVPA